MGCPVEPHRRLDLPGDGIPCEGPVWAENRVRTDRRHSGRPDARTGRSSARNDRGPGLPHDAEPGPGIGDAKVTVRVRAGLRQASLSGTSGPEDRHLIPTGSIHHGILVGAGAGAAAGEPCWSEASSFALSWSALWSGCTPVMSGILWAGAGCVT
jgi:hypothetical protein